MYSDGLRLLADVGATKVQFALEFAPELFTAMAVLSRVDHTSLERAVRAFLTSQGLPDVRYAALSVPNPLGGDRIKLTNHP